VLTFGCARTHRALSASVSAVFALALMAAAGISDARAQEIRSGGCIGGWHYFNCVTRWAPAGDPYVRSVPQSTDEAAGARTEERDRRWVDRCRPSLKQDRYGVARYHYAMPGCEFGVGEY
jgi:hypothetical protein